jgi:hypothetical protein
MAVLVPPAPLLLLLGCDRAVGATAADADEEDEEDADALLSVADAAAAGFGTCPVSCMPA